MSVGAVVLVIGDVMNDVVVRPRAATADGTDTPADIVQSPGGSGANQAAWLASMGASVRLAGRVGKGDAARHTHELEKLGASVLLSEDPVVATGTVVSFVSDDGERSMFTDRGANRLVSENDLPESLLDGIRLLHVSGYQFIEDASRLAVSNLMRHARQAGVTTSVDPASAAGIAEIGAASFLELTVGVDMLFPNLAEGRLLTGLHEPPAVLSALAEHFHTVVLKLGPDGALIASAGAPAIHVAAGGPGALDSTGAGDAFWAGFIAAWLDGRDLTTCGEAGAALAADAVSRLGGRPS